MGLLLYEIFVKRGDITYVLFNDSSIHIGKVILFHVPSLDDPGEDVDGHGEDDGAVVLRRDAAQRLQVAQLGNQQNLIFFLFLACFEIIPPAVLPGCH